MPPRARSDRTQRADAPTSRPAVQREEILSLAAALFAQHGYRATNLQLVAERLSVTRQALYYQFKSKDEILAALFDQLMTKLETAVATRGEWNGAPDFVIMLRAHIAVIIENRDLAAVLLHERPEMAKIKDLPAAERRHAYTEQFVKAYAIGVQEGRLRRLDPVIAANAAIAAANATVWWFHPEKTSALATVDTWCEMIMHGVIDVGRSNT
jgi:AcrR family transcriptional regulator